jgi:hypothetical protein
MGGLFVLEVMVPEPLYIEFPNGLERIKYLVRPTCLFLAAV